MTETKKDLNIIQDCNPKFPNYIKNTFEPNLASFISNFAILYIIYGYVPLFTVNTENL